MKDKTSPTPSSRREFLKQSSRLGLLCGLGCFYAQNLKLHGAGMSGAATPDPKKLNYCGYTCPAECPMKAAGLSNDIEQKREAYETWRIQERYGLEFDADKVLCNGCKTDAEELGMAVSHCPVRKCAIEKQLDCCIECDELASCAQVLWQEFPDFHKHVMNMRESYLAAQ